jgi:hypothetical protein
VQSPEQAPPQPLDVAVSEIALNWLSSAAARVITSAATLEPFSGVIALPVIAEIGCVIFWMCSLVICLPAAGATEKELI